ncbi:non-ribosomal peptide synthetase [Chitinolyticbacter meiyuanensis]|uniref:non-ribosomal peptide synthetase n=1 Tax=Chitinolyticbacter meiyuanensis TaxID=682798 RepID=UPI0011E5D524|nr:non-ribosomal peptide synthetase [Chitinolyticbacter meiyuanensis]
MSFDASQIAHRFAALAPEARRGFLAKLQEAGLQFTELPIVPAPREGRLPLSYGQRGLWLTWRLDPDSAAYNMGGVLQLSGALDVAALETALTQLIARHEVLRTVYLAEGDGEPWQHILPPSPLALPQTDLRDLADTERDVRLLQLQQALVGSPCALDREPPFRTALWRTGEAHHTLGLVLHHIAGDGWSIGLLVDELLALYEAAASNKSAALAPLPIQFADFAVWQRNWLEAGEKDRQLDYWRRQLDDGEHAPLSLPRPQTPASGDGSHTLTLPADTATALQRLARESGASLFMVIVALLQATLHRHTGQEQIRIGTPMANRQKAETQGLIGYLLNLQVLAGRVDARMRFIELLAAVRDSTLGAQQHPDLPFDALVDALQVTRRAGEHPLFQVKCTQQAATETRRTVAGLQIELASAAAGEAHFDLSVDFMVGSDGITLNFAYAAQRLDAATVQQLADTLLAFAEQAVAAPGSRLADWAVSRAAGALAGARIAHQYRTVLEGWDAAVARTPDALAVQDEAQAYSYAALDAQVAALAMQLREAGVGPETRVGLHAPRGAEFVLGVLAVLRAGAAYVPLDVALPAERLAFLLGDCGARLLLSTQPESAPGAVPVLPLRFVAAPAVADGSWPVIAPEQAAYLIYTSGSTGQPKGVVISHGALANYTQSVLAALDLPEAARNVAMVSTVSADLGHTSFYGALCSGRTLHLIDAASAFDPDRFARYIAEQRIDVLKIVPSHLQALLQAARPEDVLPAHALVVGGEATSWPLLERIAALQPACRVINHYGPTETTVGVLTQPAASASRAAAALPLGVPLANIEAWVLDATLNPVPAGASGELYLGGAGVARGYQGRPCLTAERFVAHPAGDGERLYRSGDLVRQLQDGSLEFLGRADDQVKIRGYRVELGEVRAALLAQPGVMDAQVIAGAAADGRAQLLAYLTPDTLDLSALRAALAAQLPDYLVPSALTALAALPLTANGKLDRKALPAPLAVTATQHEAPQGEMETVLAEIWCELLGVVRVGRDDSFFFLGGDSILCLKAVARARKRGLKLTAKQFFELQTLSAIAAAVQPATAPAMGIPRLPAERRSQWLPLSYAQSRLWFLWQLEPDSTAYHIAGALRLTGELDVPALRASFDASLARHESLRTVFQAAEQGLALQRIQPAGPLEIPLTDLSALLPAERDAAVRQAALAVNATPFDLTCGPLLRAALIRESTQSHVLVVVMHHIVSDGWSMQLLVDEFAAHYLAQRQGPAAALPPLAIQYADYALWQRQWLEAGEQARQLAYWREHLGEVHPVLQLPADRPRRADGRYRGADLALSLPATLVDAVQRRAQAEGATLFMVLLAAFQVLLHRQTGQPDIRIGVPIANRQRVETEGVIGFFVNTQVLRGRLHGRSALHEVLAEARQAALGAQAHQDLPFEQLVEALQPQRSLGSTPLFQVMFNHQRGDLRALSSLPGLTIDGYPLSEQEAQFELTLNSHEHPDGRVDLLFNYAAELFEPDTVAGWARQLQAILHALATAPEQAVGDLLLLNEAEQASLQRWGVAPVLHDGFEPVQAQFERLVVEQPDAIALVHGEVELSYAELNRRANAVAVRLIAQGVAPDARVGIAVERSIGMVVGLLAILKAGGAYVPLDPDYPAERLAYIMADSGIALLLTQSAVREGIPVPDGLPVLLLDALAQDEAAADPQVAVHAHNLAYVIYTSGSTGKPKGVGIPHAALHQHSHASIGFFGLSAADRMLQFSTLNFDGFVEQLFPPLLTGAAVVLRGPELWDSATFHHELLARRISVVDLTTAYWLVLVQDFARMSIRDYGALRQVHAGGEAMPPEGVRAWQAAGLAHVKLLNTYGPTEATVTASVLDCAPYVSGAKPMPAQMPIGEVLPGRGLRVVDADLNPVPPGVPGELCIGGPLLARGYGGRPGLTAERFVADPFDAAGGRLYRTGDLVRWRNDGQLEYLGRIDFQVKVRGFRIELGEIEAQLLAITGVREAVVLAQEGATGIRLLAYAAIESGFDLGGPALRANLAAALPDYMVPAAVVVVPRLPLNPNGKIDRKALPAVDEAAEQVAPVGELETALAAFWAELLGLASVGRHDNFFELGGHSLLALQLVQRIQAQWGETSVSLLDVLRARDVASLAAAMVARAEDDDRDVLIVNRDAAGVPLFLFPGLFVNTAEYKALIGALARHNPVYGFVSHALTAQRWRDFTVAGMAADYAAYIRTRVRDGRCALAGWSLGGELALETARQLEADGIQVSFVGLIDVAQPLAPNRPPLTPQQLQLVDDTVASWLARSGMRAQWQALFERLAPAQRDQYRYEVADVGDALPCDGAGIQAREYQLWAEINVNNAVALHRHGRIAAPLHAWHAEQTVAAGKRRAWARHADTVREVMIDGVGHLDIVRAPAFLTSFAAALAQAAEPRAVVL